MSLDVVIAWAIENKGINWAWGNLDGAASLIYHNKRDNTLNIITNGERPLFFATTKGDRYLFVASESWMIRNVCKRMNFKLKKDINLHNSYIKYEKSLVLGFWDNPFSWIYGNFYSR